MNKRFRFLFFGLVLVYGVVCSTTPAAAASSGNPEQLVNQLEADLATARANQVDVLSPGLYREALSAFI